MISRVSMPVVHPLHSVADLKATLQTRLRAYLATNPPVVSAPPGSESAAHQDITPDRWAGAQWEAYQIGKTFYARITLVTHPPMTKWYKVGPWPTV